MGITPIQHGPGVGVQASACFEHQARRTGVAPVSIFTNCAHPLVMRMAATVVSETEAAWILETGATPVLRHRSHALCFIPSIF
jgi:hypothetical protein